MRIVISGSMKFYNKMVEYKELLSNMGHTVIIPPDDDWENINKEEIEEYKRKASMEHFEQIANENTNAILVINETKNGKENYIGANSFAEIAIAFYFNKKIFLLNDMYESYRDELTAWGGVPLNGMLEKINIV